MQTIFSKIIFIKICLVLFFVPIISNAQNNVPASPAGGGLSSSYTAITPGGFFGSGQLTGQSIESMLLFIFRASIILAVILAVLMLIYGGLQYMASESILKKGEGVERIKAALLGLFIALVSILILNTIFGGAGSFATSIFP